MHAGRLEPGLLGAAGAGSEGAGARERAALRVEEQLGPVAAVEVRAARARGSGAGLSAAWRPIGTIRSLSPLPMQRTSRSSSDDAALVERRRPPRRAGRRRTGARSARGRGGRAAASRRRLDQALGLAGRERSRQLAPAPREVEARRRGCPARAPSSCWWRKKARIAAAPARDRRGRAAGGAQAPRGSARGRRSSRSPASAAEERRQLREVAAVRVDRAAAPVARASARRASDVESVLTLTVYERGCARS